MTTRPMPPHTTPTTQWWNEPTSAERALADAERRTRESGDEFLALMARRAAEDEAELDALRRRREQAEVGREMRFMHGAFAWLVGSCIGGALVVLTNFIVFGGINP